MTDPEREREVVGQAWRKVVSHDRYVTFPLDKVAVSQRMFHEILIFIGRLPAPLAPA